MPNWCPEHFLDVGELAAAVAIGYDWLYDSLSETERDAIVKGLVKLALQPGVTHIGQPQGWFYTGSTNWNSVCNGGLTLAALAVAEREPEISEKILNNSLESVKFALKEYEPEGGFAEGGMYWGYGTNYLAMMFSSLQTALGDDFGLPRNPAFERTPLFRQQIVGTSGKFFNWGDCIEESRTEQSLFWFARYFGVPAYAQMERKAVQQKLQDRVAELEGKKKVPWYRNQERFDVLDLVWYDATSSEAKSLPLDALFRGPAEIGVFRGSWTDPDAVYLGFKSGGNREGRGHLDAGSFVVDGDGIRWGVALGADNYSLKAYFVDPKNTEYLPQMYRYFRKNNLSKNTLSFGGEIQNIFGVAKVQSFESTPERASAVVDLSDVYEGQAAGVRRGFALLRREQVLIQDEITDPKADLRWAMLTKAKIQITGDSAELSLDGKKWNARIIEPEGAVFESFPAKPSLEEENQNTGVSVLAVRISAIRGSCRLAITLGAPEKNLKVDIVPLLEWNQHKEKP